MRGYESVLTLEQIKYNLSYHIKSTLEAQRVKLDPSVSKQIEEEIFAILKGAEVSGGGSHDENA